MALHFWAHTALKFLTRSRKTTLALGLMIASAVAMLVLIAAIATGINDCMVQNATGLFSGQISGENLPRTLLPDQLMTQGVSAVLQRFHTRGMLKNDTASVPLTLIGLAPEEEKKHAFLWRKIQQGRFLDKTGFNQLLIPPSTAALLKVDVGDVLLFHSRNLIRSLKVTGIIETGIDRYDRGVGFCNAEILADHADTWDCAVFLAPKTEINKVLDHYTRLGFMGTFLAPWTQRMPDLKQLIDLNGISMGLVMVLVLGVVSFGIGCAFTIVILTTMREYGIMKAMGVTAMETAGLIGFQVILLNLMATAAGTLAGILAVAMTARTGIDLSAFTSHNPYFVVSGLIIPRLTPAALVLPSLLSFCFSLLSTLWPILLVLRRSAAEILRQ